MQPNMKLFIFMSLVCNHILAQSNYPLDYMCHADGTFDVYNPRPELYFSASAYNADDNFKCTTTGVKNETSGQVLKFTISGCDKDKSIGFTMGTRSTNNSINDGVISGPGETYMIKCAELQQDGILYQTNLRLTIVEPDPTDSDVSSLPTVDVTFSIKSSIWTYDHASKVTTAEIGTMLYWHIKGPMEYDLLPVSCIAYGGTTVGGSTSKVLTDHGCTVDSTLTSHFSTAYGPDSSIRSEIKTSLHAFKFIDHEYITLACTVRVCEKGSTPCQQNCTNIGRKRRSSPFSRVELQHLSDLVGQTDGKRPLTQETATVPTIANSRGKVNDKPMSGFIVNQIRITDWSSSACNTGGSQVLLILCAVLSSVLTSRAITYFKQ